ncbi:hypothetical protein EZJ55_23665 [Microcystis aeruginosa EAWAG127a]|jgi:hypothetical protein|uniref:Uncharacterized protein n=1 Tax=Microcystis aeruginosa EAWAG127a TaxID=2529855 RepID=A0A5J5M059_MICAE|nr:hypothetical protein [Microcystis aeruginosa]KAB0243101.1 hypothetical protein EZJ55_23665 [Microcystis aeruginosa EAWAG127a]
MLLNLAGTIEGQVNDAPVEAMVSGFLDTEGKSINHFQLIFIKPVPITFNPIITGNCWNSSYHPNAIRFLPIRDRSVVNFGDISRGSYITSRSVEFPTLDTANRIVLTSDVNTTEGLITANNGTINGTYNGPTDLIGITDYSFVLRRQDSTSITVSTTANIVCQDGSALPVSITSTYSGLSVPTTFLEQHGEHYYGNQRWDGKVMSFDWVGVVYS